jgi:predicted phage tail protein
MSKRMVLAPLPAGRGGVGKIVAGVALVAAAVVLGPIAAPLFYGTAAAGGVIGGFAAGAIGSIGLSMIFGGVAELLTPTPKMPNVKNIGGSSTSGRDESEQLNSFTFDKSNANTIQGDVVPVLYGERIVGALPVLSFGLELQNYL